MSGTEQSGTILFHSPGSHESWPRELQKALPSYNVHTSFAEVDPDDVVAAVVWNPPSGMLTSMRNLRLIQVMGAGVESLLSDQLPLGVPVARLVDPGLTVRMSEYVLMHCLSLHRQVPDLQRAQRAHDWTYIAPAPPSETCVGILGVGVLGSSCARILSSAGFSVVGWSRSKKTDPGFPCYSGRHELEEFKRRADIIVILLPLTDETENLVDDDFFAGVKRGAALINVGRGKHVVEDALINALDTGVLRHAVLDVFRTEPLPKYHSFWDHPKITVTPHNSSATHPATALEQVVENIKLAAAGLPPKNQVDLERGY